MVTERADTEPSFEVGYWVHSRPALPTILPSSARIMSAANSPPSLSFEAYGAKRVELQIAALNRRSQAVAERLGFELEATLRARGRDNAGRLDATVIYAMFDVASLKAAVPD